MHPLTSSHFASSVQMSHFPPGEFVPINDAWELPRHIPRKLVSSRGNRLEPPPRQSKIKNVFRVARQASK